MAATAPLEGVRVLDFTTVFLGPYCTKILAEMGADVIKVESSEGDAARWVGPSHSPGMGGTFLVLNSGKRSISVDLKQKQGRDALAALIADVDVLVHSMRPAASRRLGLDYESVAALNPRVVHCAAEGFDGRGPNAGRPAYDDIIQAECGLAALQGEMAEGEPTYAASVIADKTVGLLLLSAVLAALFERERTGLGQSVTVPMLEAMVVFVLAEHAYGRVFTPALAPAGYPRALSANRRPYRTADGHIAVMPYNNKHWTACFSVIGRGDLVNDERFADIGARTANIDAAYAALAAALTARGTAEWLELFNAADVPCGAVVTPEELLDSEDFHARDVLGERDHPTEGAVRTLPLPLRFSRNRYGAERPAPHLGEQSVDVLREAGLSAQAVRDLVDGGIVRVGAPS